MASSVIHMCVASEINKKLNRDTNKILLGSIAPDIAKHLGRAKRESHFSLEDSDYPNMEMFLNKYQKHLSNDFVLGYYIHLYTDYLWFKYFMPDFVLNGQLYLLDGNKVELNQKEIVKYFYNDYTTLNKCLIEKYKLNTDIFNKKIAKQKNIITEIPMNLLQLIVDKSKSIIEKSKEEKSYVFDLELVDKFISNSVDAIISSLEDIGYIKK